MRARVRACRAQACPHTWLPMLNKCKHGRRRDVPALNRASVPSRGRRRRPMRGQSLVSLRLGTYKGPALPCVSARPPARPRPDLLVGAPCRVPHQRQRLGQHQRVHAAQRAGGHVLHRARAGRGGQGRAGAGSKEAAVRRFRRRYACGSRPGAGQHAQARTSTCKRPQLPERGQGPRGPRSHPFANGCAGRVLGGRPSDV